MSTDDRISRDLEAAVRHVSPPPAGEVTTEVTRRHRTRRRRRRTAVATASCAAIIAVVAGAVALTSSNPAEEVVAGPGESASSAPSSPPSSAPATLPDQPTEEELAESWRELPAGPLEGRTGFASAWTGSELVIWGGEVFRGEPALGAPTGDGAAYDPVTESWRMLPPAPGPARIDAAGVWTGEEVVIVGGRDDAGAKADAIAYDPGTDQWRTLPEGPLGNAFPYEAIWTGSRIVLTTTRQNAAGRQPQRVLALDPATGEWDRLPDPPREFTEADLVTVGDRLFLFTSALDKGNHSTGGPIAVAEWDRERGVWRAGPDLVGLFPQAFTAEAASGSLIAVDYRLNAVTAPVDDIDWSTSTSSPLGKAECGPQSTVVSGALFFYYCGQVALVGAGPEWVDLNAPDSARLPATSGTASTTALVATGDRVLVWGTAIGDRSGTEPEQVLWELDTSILE